MRVAHRWVGPPLLRRLRATVTAAERVPLSGGLIIASNHRSFLDHYLLNAACPRPMHFLGKSELATGPFGWFNEAMGMVPVQRGTGDLRAIDKIVDLLRGGTVVGIFPEGTRSRTGELYRFRSGLARIAATAEVPAIAAGLVGTAEAWPPNTLPSPRRPPAGLLAVHFGALVPAPTQHAASRREFTRLMREEVRVLCGQPLAVGFAPMPSGSSGSSGRRPA